MNFLHLFPIIPGKHRYLGSLPLRFSLLIHRSIFNYPIITARNQSRRKNPNISSPIKNTFLFLSVGVRIVSWFEQFRPYEKRHVKNGLVLFLHPTLSSSFSFSALDSFHILQQTHKYEEIWASSGLLIMVHSQNRLFGLNGYYTPLLSFEINAPKNVSIPTTSHQI